jgi:hypothetical protein
MIPGSDFGHRHLDKWSRAIIVLSSPPLQSRLSAAKPARQFAPNAPGTTRS